MAPAEKPADTRQSYAIESEMDLTRERLAATIDQLVYRASPKTIARREVANVKALFVDAQGSPRTDNILKAAGAVAGFVVLVVLMRKVAS